MATVQPAKMRIATKRVGATILAAGSLFFLTAALASTARAQTLSVVHVFTGGADGQLPQAVTLDRHGNLYGNNEGGVAGEIFSVKRAGSSWVVNPLFTFPESSWGTGPNQPTVGPDNSLYESNSGGGMIGGPCGDTVGCGTVLNLKPPATVCITAICYWTPTLLHTFTGEPNDGQQPYGGVTFDLAGNLYGTTQLGGSQGNGTVYELTPGNGEWTETILHSFGGVGDGALPWSGVVLDQAGNLYGTTQYGGTANLGTVYQLSRSGSGWTSKVLYSFQNTTDGWWPIGGLVFDSAGNLYGTSSVGGAGNGGTVFELTPSGGGWTYHLVYALPGGPANKFGPVSTLALDESGNLYGTTAGGGSYDFGTAFKLTRSGQGWTYTSLHDFTGGEDGGSVLGFSLDTSGKLFGAAAIGGHYDCQGFTCGVIWEITP